MIVVDLVGASGSISGGVLMAIVEVGKAGGLLLFLDLESPASSKRVNLVL